MELKTAFGITASVIGSACFIPYILDIYKKKTRPHIYTWLIWTILQVTGVVAMYNSGAGIGILALATGSVLCAYTCILSIKFGTKNITTFDTFCLIGALISIAVYIFLKQPLLSIILISAIDFVGFLPTLRKAYIEPYSETLAMFAFFALSGTFTMLALHDYSFTTILYPLTLIGINIIATLVIWMRRRGLPNPSEGRA
ncbi:MAG TPA: hypothetical protein VK806_11190 [Bacteroidia bacterium]|jgi:hypothetical protein|nr:hypothetical protein [Bacteroidia bacterium]